MNPRGLCLRCLRPPLTCYCAHVKPFDPGIRFVILIHKREQQKRINTGRLAHLCLENSLLLPGYDSYDKDESVNTLLDDKAYNHVVLYPGKNSTDLETIPLETREAMRPLNVFVIDGIWRTAKKTIENSKRLRELPRVCFTPAAQSRFRVRIQPEAAYCSTVEAIHHTIELLGPKDRKHDNLLEVFDRMVEQQLKLQARPKQKCQWIPKLAPLLIDGARD